MADLVNPQTSTAAAFNRKVFVGFGAGAVAAIAPAGARSQIVDFGKPHPPLVPEDDPAIEAQSVRLSRPGITVDAYAAWPKDVGPATPGIVLVQHIWGVDSTIRDDVRRYAKAGFTCIAPDLYVRSQTPAGDGSSDISVFRPAAAALDDHVVTGDLLAARTWVTQKTPGAKIGITGFCMGGGIALRQLVGTDSYAAASIFYGPVRREQAGAPVSADAFDYATQIRTPVRGNYGQRDTSIAAADVQAVFAKLSIPHELSIYSDAGHAFFDDTRSAYVPTAAADAWAKTLTWFRRYLS